MFADENGELHLSKKDFKIEWYSGSGAGGQHRNKHQNCCRIIHIKSGLMGRGTESRDRQSNQAKAFERLTKLILAKYYRELEYERLISNETIRTYHEPRNTVKDHVSGHTESYKEVVLDGNIGNMVDERRKAKLYEGI